MKRIMNWLAPKKRALEMLAGQSANILASAKELKSFVEDYSKFDRIERKAKAQHIKTLKVQSDEIHYRMVLILGSGSSANKSAMYSIALLLHEAADLLAESSAKFMVMGIERVDIHTLKLINALNSSAEELNMMFSTKKPDEFDIHYKKLQSLKGEAEDVCDEALSELFHFYKNSIDIMKYREIYGLLDNFIGKCRNAGEFIYISYAKR